jgi:hypothetical protein
MDATVINPATAAAIVGVESDQLDAIGPEEFCARALAGFLPKLTATVSQT